MIFKQIKEIITGKKTQTRRIKKPGEQIRHIEEPYTESAYLSTVYTAISSRVKWQVGRWYAVQPGRGKSQVYLKYEKGQLELAHERQGSYSHYKYGDGWDTVLNIAKLLKGDQWRFFLLKDGYRPLRIKITAIRCERLQDITEADAIAEGMRCYTEGGIIRYYDYHRDMYPFVNAVDSYRTLWESIHGDASWEKNPEVWVLEFQAVTS